MTSQLLDENATGCSDTDQRVSWRLAEDCELLGQYEGSAFAEPQYLLRRGDGQLIHVSRLLYSVASSLDGTRDATEIADRVAAHLGRTVSADNIQYLVKHKLQPAGLVWEGGAPPTRVPRAKPLLALRFRTKLLPERFHRGATTALRPLFWPPVVVVVLGGLVGLDAWVSVTQGLSVVHQTRQVIVHPMQFLLLNAMIIAACLFHEFGHATAARYGGATPGAMGIGVYLAFPVFYTDVTDSYRLNRMGRLRTDLGGVYFNAIAIVAAGAAYWTTQFKALLVFLVVSQLQVLYQFLPTVRMDGYYVVSDLIGVPNLFAFIRPVAARLFRPSDPATGRLHQLKPRARLAITVWVSLTVPILLANVGFFAAIAPRVLPALWSATERQAGLARLAAAHGDLLAATNASIGLIVLAVTGAGLLLTGAFICFRIGQLALRYGIPRFLRLIGRPAGALLTLTVGVIVAAIAILALGFVEKSPILVRASVVCSVASALTLATFVFVAGRAEGRPADAFSAERGVSPTVPVRGRPAPGLSLKVGANDGDLRLPIALYDALRAADIVPRLRGLSSQELRTVRAWEAQRRARVTVLDRIDALLERAAARAQPGLRGTPIAIEGYDNLTVAKILPILSRLGPEELEAVAERERCGAARRTILMRITSLQQRSASRRESGTSRRSEPEADEQNRHGPVGSPPFPRVP